MNTKDFAFPKPGDVKNAPEPVHVYPDGREQCNLMTAEGKRIYKGRIKEAHERQGAVCCLYGHIKECPGPLRLEEAVFEHEEGRTAGRRDDRIWVNGKRKSGAAHWLCNFLKGSRKIRYNG